MLPTLTSSGTNSPTLLESPLQKQDLSEVIFTPHEEALTLVPH